MMRQFCASNRLWRLGGSSQYLLHATVGPMSVLNLKLPLPLGDGVKVCRVARSESDAVKTVQPRHAETQRIAKREVIGYDQASSTQVVRKGERGAAASCCAAVATWNSMQWLCDGESVSRFTSTAHAP